VLKNPPATGDRFHKYFLSLPLLDCLLPNSSENTAKDLLHLPKMPVNCFSTEITDPLRAGELPRRGQPGWGGLGSVPATEPGADTGGSGASGLERS